jgi:hypothetical protein
VEAVHESLPYRRDNFQLLERDEGLLEKRLELLNAQRRHRFTLSYREKARLQRRILELEGEIARLKNAK